MAIVDRTVTATLPDAGSPVDRTATATLPDAGSPVDRTATAILPDAGSPVARTATAILPDAGSPATIADIVGADLVVWYQAATDPGFSAGNGASTLADISGNSYDASQETTSQQPTWSATPNRLDYDLVDDSVVATLPATTGTMIVGTTNGTWVMEVDIPSGAYTLGPYGMWDEMTELVLANRVLTVDEISQIETLMQSRGAVANLDSGVTSLLKWFVNRTEITKINLNNLDVTNVSSFSQLFLGCSNLQSVQINQWDTPNATTFSFMFFNNVALEALDISNLTFDNATSMFQFIGQCSSLTSLTVGTAFDTVPFTSFSQAFTSCALNQTSVDAILISINNAGTSNGSLGINGGTNATPSATGQAAADALRARGWTVNLNGY